LIAYCLFSRAPEAGAQYELPKKRHPIFSTWRSCWPIGALVWSEFNMAEAIPPLFAALKLVPKSACTRLNSAALLASGG
jgi:hypothetical protein